MNTQLSPIQSMASWSLDRIRDWQWEKIRELLQKSLQQNNFYGKILAAKGIRPEDIKSWSDFQHLPILTKTDLQQQTAELSLPNLGGILNQTGGSSGQMLHFLQDADYLSWARQSRQWGFALLGFTGNNKHVFLWGSEADAKAYQIIRSKIGNYLRKRMFVNTFILSEHTIGKICQKLIRWQPEFIFGYASSLELFADWLLENQQSLNCRAVQSTAGTLYPSLRSKLANAFGPNVFDRYGSREVSIIAHECHLHLGLHECMFHNYLEYEQVHQNYYKLLVTNLHNAVFPFIRYDIGDFALPSKTPCSCGCTFPLISRIWGREVEIIKTPSGKYIDGERFTHIFYRFNGVKQFQMNQNKPNRLMIKIVAGNSFDLQLLSQIKAAIDQITDHELSLDIELVKQIPPLASGKRAFVFRSYQEAQ